MGEEYKVLTKRFVLLVHGPLHPEFLVNGDEKQVDINEEENKEEKKEMEEEEERKRKRGRGTWRCNRRGCERR